MNELEGNSVAAAHELKTPLVLIRQLSLQLAATDDSAAQTETVRRIQLTAERSLRLVDSLTKAARLEDALFELEPIQMASLCRDVIDEMNPLVQTYNQNFAVRLTRRPLVAVGNRELLKSLLTGLIDNALQHNLPLANIEISNFQRGGEAVISIRDHGAIIDPQEFKSLQESLGKRAQPIAARPLSSGLGLLIAQKLLEAMNGHLSVERHRAGGMTFSTHLPLSRQLSLLEL